MFKFKSNWIRYEEAMAILIKCIFFDKSPSSIPKHLNACNTRKASFKMRSVQIIGLVISTDRNMTIRVASSWSLPSPVNGGAP